MSARKVYEGKSGSVDTVLLSVEDWQGNSKPSTSAWVFQLVCVQTALRLLLMPQEPLYAYLFQKKEEEMRRVKEEEEEEEGLHFLLLHLSQDRPSLSRGRELPRNTAQRPHCHPSPDLQQRSSPQLLNCELFSSLSQTILSKPWEKSHCLSHFTATRQPGPDSAERPHGRLEGSRVQTGAILAYHLPKATGIMGAGSGRLQLLGRISQTHLAPNPASVQRLLKSQASRTQCSVFYPWGARRQSSWPISYNELFLEKTLTVATGTGPLG
ncbi:uncharacterized protein LOC104859140 [Fukomys damarensis]|uniref:uncharacterized protein LOC104859140 n=1 Tax=Fukomys damarensis TaxID=885580 RepID=UPI00053F857B|nr:uncharacterized protein LOC104859140 [Fukomys damarensis]